MDEISKWLQMLILQLLDPKFWLPLFLKDKQNHIGNTWDSYYDYTYCLI